MAFWLRLASAIDTVNERLHVIAAVALGLACIVAVSAALAHFAYDVGSNAWLESQWYLFSVVVMLGAAATLRRNEHVRVDILVTLLSPRGRLWLDLIGAIVFLIPVCVLFALWSWPVFVDAWSSGEVSANAGGLIRWPFKLLLPLGFGLVALQGVAEVIKRAAALTGQIDDREIASDYERPVQ